MSYHKKMRDATFRLNDPSKGQLFVYNHGDSFLMLKNDVLQKSLTFVKNYSGSTTQKVR